MPITKDDRILHVRCPHARPRFRGKTNKGYRADSAPTSAKAHFPQRGYDPLGDPSTTVATMGRWPTSGIHHVGVPSLPNHKTDRPASPHRMQSPSCTFVRAEGRRDAKENSKSQMIGVAFGSLKTPQPENTKKTGMRSTVGKSDMQRVRARKTPTLPVRRPAGPRLRRRDKSVERSPGSARLCRRLQLPLRRLWCWSFL